MPGGLYARLCHAFLVYSVSLCCYQLLVNNGDDNYCVVVRYESHTSILGSANKCRHNVSDIFDYACYLLQ